MMGLLDITGSTYRSDSCLWQFVTADGGVEAGVALGREVVAWACTSRTFAAAMATK